MLLDFTVGNYGPFRDDVTLSMSTTNGKEHMENVLRSDCPDHDAVTSALIFGPNAAGKTFVIDALRTICCIVQSVDEDIPSSLYVPFWPSPECRGSTVRLGIRLVLDGILYEYKVEYKERQITAESLHYYPNRYKARVFSRSVYDGFKGAKKRLVDMTSPGMTYLAVAAFAGDPICSRVRSSLLGDFIFLPSDLESLVQCSCRLNDASPRREVAMKAMDSAGLDICDYAYSEAVSRSSEPYERANNDAAVRDIVLKHGFTSAKVDEAGRFFPLDAESIGTLSVFGLIAPLIDALEDGKVLVMDDLGAHLHPLLARWIVQQFDEYRNPNGAQLVASTHEVSLMDIEELLRRDQIWFVNKDREDGHSDLYCLSDFDGVRKDTDVIRRYLDGRFYAVPWVKHRGVLQ